MHLGFSYLYHIGSTSKLFSIFQQRHFLKTRYIKNHSFFTLQVKQKFSSIYVSPLDLHSHIPLLLLKKIHKFILWQL